MSSQWRGGFLLAVGAIVVAVAIFLVSVSVVPRVFTYLASGEAGFSADRQLAFGQLVVAFLGLGLASGLGFIAVQQLVAGRQSVQQGALALAEDRRARDDAKEAQIHAVLRSLLLELHRNRLAALAQERRIVVTAHGQQVPAFSTRMADALVAGALWVLADVDSILDLVAQAYEDTADLAGAVSPIRWLSVGLSGFGVAGFWREDTGFRWPWRRRHGFRPSRRDIIFVLIGAAVVGVVGAESYAFSSGLATRARVSIEQAMSAIHRRLGQAAEVDWAKYDARFESKYRVLPSRAPSGPERALGWFGRWFGDRFGL